MNAICRPHSMCGCAAPRWPRAGQDRHTDAFSCAMPISATLPAPPAAAASIYGRAISSSFSPLANRRTGMPCAFANPVNLGGIRLADLPERRRRRDRVPPLPAQELAHHTHALQPRHIRLQENPVHRSAGERHVIPQ